MNFYYGAMTCGKSERFISAARNYQIRGLPIVTAMPAIGMREPGFTTSRNGEKWAIDIATTPDTDLHDVFFAHFGHKAIRALLIDEAQFLTEEQVRDLEAIAKIHDTSVIAFGLRSNVQRKLFDGSKKLIELADRTEKIITMCACGNQAEYNGRFANGVFHVGEPIVWIDKPGSEAHYDAMCGDCYLYNLESPGAIAA